MRRALALKWLGRIAKWGLFAVVLALVGRALWHQFGLLDWRSLHFRAWPVIGAAACLLAVPPVQMVSYRALLGAYATAPPWRLMPAIAWIPPMGKYLPGASVVGAVYMLSRLGVSATLSVGVVLAMDGIAAVVGLMIGSPLLLTPAIRRYLPAGPAICAVVILIGIVCLHPRVYSSFINWVLTLLGKAKLDRVPPARKYFLPICCAGAQWVLAGVALWLMALSLTDVAAGRIGIFISVAALGYTIGYLAIFAAAGLGVREAVFVAGLGPLLTPAALAAPVVVGQRIVQTCTELSAALVGLWFYRHFGRLEENVPAREALTGAGGNR